MKILYAEDEFTNRKLVEFFCKKENIECDLAKNGKEAIALFNKKKFDLVFLDQYMPYLNGEDVALEIQKKSPQTPIIAITSDDSIINHLKSSVFEEVLIKPISPQEYKKVIEKYVETE